jgi:hypothetical protein
MLLSKTQRQSLCLMTKVLIAPIVPPLYLDGFPDAMLTEPM